MSPLSLIKKRDLLYSDKTSAAEASKQAEKFLEDGLRVDALSLFEKANDQAGLDKLSQIALDEGDSFLLLKVYKAKGEEPPENLLKAIGDKAFEMGKYHDAKTAYEHLGDESLLAKVKPHLEGEEEVHLPAGAETEV